MQIFNVSGWARLVNMSVEGLGTAVLVLRDRKSAIDRVVVVVDKVRYERMFYATGCT